MDLGLVGDDIDYAEQKGWVSAEGSLVRAHIESE